MDKTEARQLGHMTIETAIDLRSVGYQLYIRKSIASLLVRGIRQIPLFLKAGRFALLKIIFMGFFSAFALAQEPEAQTNYEKVQVVMYFSDKGANGFGRGGEAFRRANKPFIALYDIISRNAQNINLNENKSAPEIPVLVEMYLIGPDTPKKLYLADHMMGDGTSWTQLSHADYSRMEAMFEAKGWRNPSQYIDPALQGDKNKMVARMVDVFIEAGGENAIEDFSLFKKRVEQYDRDLQDSPKDKNNIGEIDITEANQAIKDGDATDAASINAVAIDEAQNNVATTLQNVAIPQAANNSMAANSGSDQNISSDNQLKDSAQVDPKEGEKWLGVDKLQFEYYFAGFLVLTSALFLAWRIKSRS